MNCKQGDLAVIVRSLDGNHGALVRVVRDSGYRDDAQHWWVCEALQPIRCADRDVRAGDRLCVADADLSHIRDNDGKDETLTWVDKPERVTRMTGRSGSEALRLDAAIAACDAHEVAGLNGVFDSWQSYAARRAVLEAEYSAALAEVSIRAARRLSAQYRECRLPREGSLPDRANPARDESPKAIEPDPKGRAQGEQA